MLTVSGLWAQAPNQFSYQTVLRNSEGEPLAGKDFTINAEILSGSVSGLPVFTESHQVTSNSAGQVSLIVGSVEDISTVSWQNGPFFLQISANSKIIEIRQLISVPFAKYTTEASIAGTLDYTSLTGTPDFSTWDKDSSDDFDGAFNSLRMWSVANNHLYYNEGNINIQTSESTPAVEALNINGAVLYNGAAADTVPGALFYDPAGNGSFRFFDNNGDMKVLGTGTITFDDPDPGSGNFVTYSNVIWKNRTAIGEKAHAGYDFKDNVMVFAEDSQRVYFYDTSNSGSFPSGDWQFRFNDLEQGGKNYFALFDSTHQSTPVMINSGITHDALFVDANGNAGFGTNTPSREADVAGNVAATLFSGNGTALTGISGGSGQPENTGSTTIGADSDENGTGDIIFETANQPRMSIQNGGSVKIGSNDPAEADLDASGLNATVQGMEVTGGVQTETLLAFTTTFTNPASNTFTFDAAIPGEVVFFDSAIGPLTITGFMNGEAGQRLTIVNKGTDAVTFQASFVETQRLVTLGFSSIALHQYDSATFIFNGNQWNCLEVIQ